MIEYFKVFKERIIGKCYEACSIRKNITVEIKDDGKRHTTSSIEKSMNAWIEKNGITLQSRHINLPKLEIYENIDESLTYVKVDDFIETMETMFAKSYGRHKIAICRIKDGNIVSDFCYNSDRDAKIETFTHRINTIDEMMFLQIRIPVLYDDKYTLNLINNLLIKNA